MRLDGIMEVTNHYKKHYGLQLSGRGALFGWNRRRPYRKRRWPGDCRLELRKEVNKKVKAGDEIPPIPEGGGVKDETLEAPEGNKKR